MLYSAGTRSCTTMAATGAATKDGSVIFVGNDYQNMKKTLSDEKIKISN